MFAKSALNRQILIKRKIIRVEKEKRSITNLSGSDNPNQSSYKVQHSDSTTWWNSTMLQPKVHRPDSTFPRERAYSEPRPEDQTTRLTSSFLRRCLYPLHKTKPSVLTYVILVSKTDGSDDSVSRGICASGSHHPVRFETFSSLHRRNAGKAHLPNPFEHLPQRLY